MMITLKSRLPLAILLILAAAGCVTGFAELRKAMARSQSVYQVDTIGSQIESDLEYSTQEARRAFLYALGVADVNEQLSYVDAAHAAESQVNNRLHEFRALPGADRSAASRFERAWKGYLDIRDQIVARILEGDETAAIGIDRESGDAAFDNSVRSLHSMRDGLRVDARQRSDEVNATLKACIAGLILSMFAAVLVISQLFSIKKDREAALKEVKAANRELASAHDLENRRAAIFEMVSMHAALPHVLYAVTEIASQYTSGVGCAIWTRDTDGGLLFQAATGLPVEWAKRLKARTAAVPADILNVELRSEAAALGGSATILNLRYAGSELRGAMMIFRGRGSSGLPNDLVEHMQQLAAVVIENILLFDRLAFQAQHDALTKLPNRLLYQDRLEHAIRASRRTKEPLAVFWIDLDRYKRINDSLGHRAGDEVLCEVGRRIAGALRECDTVARAGGDEFTVLMPDAGPVDACTMAARLLHVLRQPMQLGDHEATISASIGISLYPNHGETPAILMRNADLALYEVKRNGRDNFALFVPQVADSMERRAHLERNLRVALAAGQLHLNYQPLIDREGQIEALEVLLRWNDDELGSVSPAEFIPVAEEMGAIVRIGDWVMRTALANAVLWKRMGKKIPLIAVNASSIQFGDSGFVGRVKRALEDTAFPANCLEIEVTESALMKDVDQAIEQIRSLRELGVRFSIDDFGTGYSSLNQLRTLPVDTVKIDRSFVTDLSARSKSSLTLVGGIIGLAHSLHLRVVAEGVETAEQFETLRQLGCDVNQGYFHHRPMPAEAVFDLLPARGPIRAVTSAEQELIPAIA